MARYQRQRAAGEVKRMLQQLNDLPGRAEAKVALHLLDRRARPSSKEGERGFSATRPIYDFESETGFAGVVPKPHAARAWHRKHPA